jgi:hypothetical protein
MRWVFPFFNMEAKFGPLEKLIKNDCYQSWWNFSEQSGYTLFDHKRNEEILEKLKVEPAEEKLRNWNQIFCDM